MKKNVIPAKAGIQRAGILIVFEVLMIIAMISVADALIIESPTEGQTIAVGEEIPWKIRPAHGEVCESVAQGAPFNKETGRYEWTQLIPPQSTEGDGLGRRRLIITGERVKDGDKECLDAIVTINIVLPPTTVLHGIWGDGRPKVAGKDNDNYTWKGFNLGQHYTILPVDYSDKNANAFDDSDIILKLTTAITDALDDVSDRKIAVQKVDVVAHSMGGLVVRSFCAKNPDACKNSIRKLITIDTPHEGSPLAQFLLDLALGTPLTPPVPSLCAKVILPQFNDMGMYYDKGAVSALRPSSLELNVGLGGEPRDLWAHPIIGLTPDGLGGYDKIADLWRGVQHLCERTYDRSDRPDLVPLFGDDRSDRIVSSRSQGAFFTKTTHVEGVDHLSVNGSSEVVEKVRGLLEADLAVAFEKGKF
jgi:pimeloyl-ACP methyl ester carboxylesterase